MSTQLFRNYLDIINENSQPKVQLDEGILDTLKAAVPKLMKYLGGDTAEQIAQQVKQVTGGDYTPSRENAIKVAKALGFDKIVQAQQGQSPEQVAEGLAGNWQGKLIQLMHTGIIGGALAQFFGGQALTGMQGFGGPGEILMTIGVLLLMFANTFWSSNSGMVGAMGKHGNKGWETSKGPSGRLPGDL
jgi:hypothetical protein